ncbi:hypothetical protein ACFLSW_02435 [Candidatus Bipolaricaulota bacterium]
MSERLMERIRAYRLMPRRGTAAEGLLIILLAAFFWGIGSAVAGITAHDYMQSGSLLPAIEIALSNTLGGLVSITSVIMIRRAIRRRRSNVKSIDQLVPLAWFGYRDLRFLFAGVLKGVSPCLFVAATTYVVASQAMVLQGTYIVWSVILALVFLRRRIAPLPALTKAVVLLAGVTLVSGQTELQLSEQQHLLGSGLGLAAGLGHAAFLFLWSRVTENLVDLRMQLAATQRLLAIAVLAILVTASLACILVSGAWWIPFTHLDRVDIVGQVINGFFAVGSAFVLITVGIGRLRSSGEATGYITALGLSFSVPFALVPELIIGRFTPTPLQLLGIFLFMLGFIFVGTNSSGARRNK